MNSTKAVGDPGDLAIGDFNITKNPQPVSEDLRGLQLGRLMRVFRCCQNGEWVEIGYVTEHFGSAPGEPDDWMVPSPNGSIFYETWFTQEELAQAHQQWTEGSGFNWDFIKKLLDHYKNFLPSSSPTLPLQYTGKRS